MEKNKSDGVFYFVNVPNQLMKYFLILILLIASLQSYGYKHRSRGLPRTEVGLMTNVLGCLSNKDSLDYFYLFPPFDTLWSYVLHNPDHSPQAQQELENLKEHPQGLLEFDPYYNHSIIAKFEQVLQKGEDSGIHWNSIVLQRYELSKEEPTRKLVGYDHVAPERFKGYIFVRDMLGRSTFCITITEIQKIQGYFFGGQVLNILEASTIDQYLFKETEEKKYYDWLAKNKDTTLDDSTRKALADSLIKKDILTATPIDEDSVKPRREVVERKYYEGKFDDEIPVKLFVRYQKDLRSGKVSSYDGLYKFGDQKSYVKLNITRSTDGKWIMEDDPPVGVMELELINKMYTGSWLNNESQSGYDVEMKQVDIPDKRVMELDEILEKGLVGSTAQKSTQEEEKKKSPEDEKGKDEGY